MHRRVMSRSIRQPTSTLPLALSRGIVPEQLGHRLFELPIVLVGVVRNVERLRRRTAPQQLFGSRVEQTNDQLADIGRRRCYSPISPAAPQDGTPREAIKLLLLCDRRLITGYQITATL